MADVCTAVAAVRLMMLYPFWCELFYSMKVIEDASVATLETDGRCMWVNPTFYNALPLDFKITALAHEVCHKMLHHCTRGLFFDPLVGNIAADIVVNTLLARNGFKIHPSWVQPKPEWSDWTFEDVYRELTKNLKPKPQPQGGGDGTPQDGDAQGDGKAQAGQGKPRQGEGQGDSEFDLSGAPEQWQKAWRDVRKFKGSAAEVEKFERKVEEQVAKAVASAKAMGNAPLGVEMAVDKARYIPAETWYDHLHRYMQSLRLKEYNWSRINKRQMALHDIIAPEMYCEALGEIILFVDASGSCFDAIEQARFTGHINLILAEANPEKVHVVYFDTMVHKHIEMDPGEIEFEAQPQGGGGTSFTDLFDWAEREGINPVVAIVLTDMCGTMPYEAPAYPVVWASTLAGYEGPFGETIYIN